MFFFIRMEVTEELIITLTIQDTVSMNTGEYTIEISNEFGSSSCSVDVLIEYEPPSFTQPLSDITLTLGHTATLECSFRGLPEPKTTWQVSGVELFESDKYHMERKVDKTWLEISSVNMDDTDMAYTCKAVNPVGEAVTTAKLIPQGWSDLFVMFWNAVVCSVMAVRVVTCISLIAAVSTVSPELSLPLFWLVRSVCYIS